jgi:hypothetical protein
MLPSELLASLIDYLNDADVIYIILLNKEILDWCEPKLRLRKAKSIIKNKVLKRLQAHRTSRRTFVDRLCVDIEYRKRYLFVHETDDPHICWRKCPPLCLTMRKGLKEVQRLIDKDIGMLNRVLVEIEGIPLQHLLDTYRIREI